MQKRGLAASQAVIGGVVDTAQTQRRAQVIAFGGVVVDHIENDFEAGPVQRLDHGLEFAHRVVGRRVAPIRRKKPERVVAPVVAQSALHQMAVVGEAMHRHQFHRGHAEALQMFDRRRAGQAGVSAAQWSRGCRDAAR
jgi:hypothetical protein